MLEFAETHNFENIVLIQATSPLLSNIDLDRGFECFLEAGTDSVLSVVRQKRFHWMIDKQGYAHPTNYDVFKRPRRQEFDGYMVEMVLSIFPLKQRCSNHEIGCQEILKL